MNFDHILFIASTDCFGEKLFSERSAAEWVEIKRITREQTLALMGDNSDYYYDSDFSQERINKTKNALFQRLSALMEGNSILGKFSELDSISNKQISTKRPHPLRLIKDVSSQLYWLNTNDFQVKVCDALLDAAIQAQSLGLPLDAETYLDWHEIHALWEQASSDWDCFIKSITRDVPDGLCAIFNDLHNSPLSLRHLYSWKKGLPTVQFLTLMRAIEDEAFLQMDKTNPDHALLVRAAMKQFHQ